MFSSAVVAATAAVVATAAAAVLAAAAALVVAAAAVVAAVKQWLRQRQHDCGSGSFNECRYVLVLPKTGRK